MRNALVVAGSLAQKPGNGGHTWVLLQYVLGFKRLGWEVLFLDQLAPEQCVDASGQPTSLEQSFNARYTQEVFERFGLADNFAVLGERGQPCIGRSRQDVLEHTKRSAALINVMGFLSDEDLLAAAPQRVFLDIDPGFPQMWREVGLHDAFVGYDRYVTIGANIGQPDCAVPTCGLDWITTPQPVVLDLWQPVSSCPRERFTSVATWRGAYGPVEYRGQTYGLRVHEFRKFAALPRLSASQFEVALDIHPADGKDVALLRANRWSVVDPRVVAGDPWAYRAYIQGSTAEVMIAKNIYVQAQSGWFSDRSICYLASGKPVVAQDTGLRHLYHTGEGLLTFTTVEDAVAAVEDVAADYSRHSRAARALAEEYFDSNKVLSRLLLNLGVA